MNFRYKGGDAAMEIIKDGYIVCPNCGSRMIWNSDFDMEDVGYSEKGIGSVYTCSKCKASIEICIPEETEGEQ